MLTLFLKGKSHCEKFCFRNSVCREKVSHFRLSACDGTCFVECDDLYFASFFERNCCFEEDAVLCAHAVADHNRNRSGKAKCARAADDKNGNSAGKCVAEFMSGQKPDNGCNDRNCDDCRYKNTGNTVCDLSNRCFGGCGITDHFDDLGECGVFAYTGCFAFDKSGLVDGGSGNKITGSFVNRDAFAGQCRFVDGAGTFDDHTVDRNVLTRAYDENITFFDLFDRNGGFLTVTENDSCFWCKFHQTL